MKCLHDEANLEHMSCARV